MTHESIEKSEFHPSYGGEIVFLMSLSLNLLCWALAFRGVLFRQHELFSEGYFKSSIFHTISLSNYDIAHSCSMNKCAQAWAAPLNWSRDNKKQRNSHTTEAVWVAFISLCINVVNTISALKGNHSDSNTLRTVHGTFSVLYSTM